MALPDSGSIKRRKEIDPAPLQKLERGAYIRRHFARVNASPSPILLTTCRHGLNLVVRVVADRIRYLEIQIGPLRHVVSAIRNLR
jgi:hypothetical protein